MKQRKKYYLLASDVFFVLFTKYNGKKIEIQETPNGSRKITQIKIGEQILFVSVEHNRTVATCFISEQKPEDKRFAEYKIISIHAGFYTGGNLRAIWWIEYGDTYASVAGMTTLLNWAIDSAREKLKLHTIFYNTISELLENEEDLYETTVPELPTSYRLPSLVLETV